MNRLLILLVSALFFSTHGFTATQDTARSEEVIEVPSFIVNYSLSGNIPGRVLASLCADCPREALTFDQNTLLEMNGQLSPLEELKQRTEWSGLLTVTNSAPRYIVKFTIY